MFFTFFLPLLLVFVSYALLTWYNLKIRPKKALQTFLSQGAKIPTLPPNSSDTLAGMRNYVQEHPETKAFIISLYGKAGLAFTDPDLIKEVLSNQKYYTKLAAEWKLNNMLDNKGLLKATGNNWKLHRKIVSEAFQYDLFNGMIPTIIDSVNDVIPLDEKNKKTIYLPGHTDYITSDAVCRIFFGIKSRDEYINGLPAVDEGTAIARKTIEYGNHPWRIIFGEWILNFISDYRKQKERIQNFRNVFGKKIRERMQEIQTSISEGKQSERKDLLEIFLRHRIKYNNDTAQTLSNDEILDEFSVFFVAGKDTTSLLISMSLYCYARNPEWAEKLQKEVDEVFKDIKNINLDQLNSMNVMSAFLNEVLRLYPPVPTLLRRVALEDHKIGPFEIKKGHIVNTIFIANHYNPKYFTNPNEFDPGRWLKTENKDEGTKNPYAYLPFSAGNRNCIGKHLGLIEAKIVIGLILKHFSLSVDPSYELKITNVFFNYGPAQPIPLTLTPKA